MANCSGASPLLNVAIDPCTGIADGKSEAFTIYPNPATDHLNTTGSALKATVSIAIYNHTGQLVYESGNVVNGDDVKVDVSSLKTGIYAVRVTTAEEVLSKIFVKK